MPGPGRWSGAAWVWVVALALSASFSASFSVPLAATWLGAAAADRSFTAAVSAAKTDPSFAGAVSPRASVDPALALWAKVAASTGTRVVALTSTPASDAVVRVGGKPVALASWRTTATLSGNVEAALAALRTARPMLSLVSVSWVGTEATVVTLSLAARP